MTKKHCFYISLIFAASFATLMAFSFSSLKHISNKVKAIDNPYILNLPSFSQSEGNDITTTSKGNEINFSHSGYNVEQNCWGSLSSGGYIKNTTVISGLDSITVVFQTESVDLSICYGWFDDDYVVTSGVLNSSNQIFDFGEEKPSFFKIMNENSFDVVIQSISLTYSCVETGLPEAYNMLQFTLINDGTEYAVSGYETGIKNAFVPTSYNNLPVTTIKSGAFSWCQTLEYANLNDVSLIENGAFSGCRQLTSVSFSDSLLEIRRGAFSGCSKLTSVFIPQNVELIDVAFTECDSLISINVSKNNAYFMSVDGVLYNKNQTILLKCPERKKGDFIIPNGVISIEEYAFKRCRALTSLVIPNSVTTIQASCFSNCSSLTSMLIPSSVVSISSPFEYCDDLLTVFYKGTQEQWNQLNARFKKFADDAYYSPYVEFNSEVTSFSYIENDRHSYVLTSDKRVCGFKMKDKTIDSFNVFLELPNYSFLSFARSAFEMCNSLTEIFIPDSVLSIGDFAFNSVSLARILVSFDHPKYSCLDGILYNKNQTSLICCPPGKIGSVTIPEGVTSIGFSAFYVSSLSAIVIPETTTTIGYGAFSSSSIQTIVIPNSITSIGNSAFDSCPSLLNVFYQGTKLHLDSLEINKLSNRDLFKADIEYNSSVDSLIYIENSKYSCVQTSDNRIVGVKIIDLSISSFDFEHEFSNMVVLSVARDAFVNCYNLSSYSLILPNGLEIIGKSAFLGQAYASLILPNTILRIKSSAFHFLKASITFNGTIEQWNAIEKEDYWASSARFSTIHCSDGDVNI